MNAGGFLAELEEIENLMNRLLRLNAGWMGRVHVECPGRSEPAGSPHGIAAFKPEVLNAQPADGRRHPAVLASVVVRQAYLSHLPTDRKYFERVASADEVSGVVLLRVKQIRRERFGTDGMRLDEFLHARESEVLQGIRVSRFTQFLICRARIALHRLFGRGIAPIKRSAHRTAPSRFRVHTVMSLSA
jgi:hypothetical protein